mgnify:CR=1 FL=1
MLLKIFTGRIPDTSSNLHAHNTKLLTEIEMSEVTSVDSLRRSNTKIGGVILLILIDVALNSSLDFDDFPSTSLGNNVLILMLGIQVILFVQLVVSITDARGVLGGCSTHGIFGAVPYDCRYISFPGGVSRISSLTGPVVSHRVSHICYLYSCSR